MTINSKYRASVGANYQGFFTVFSPFAIWFFSVEIEWFFNAEISHNVAEDYVT